jgi:sulfur-oxidizing protein SoxX
MRKGERVIFAIIVVVVAVVIGVRGWLGQFNTSEDPGIPYYSTASPEVSHKALAIYRDNNCKDCHSLWTTRNMLQSVPAPRLDGIGSLRSEEWLFKYFSAENPQAILPSRLKEEFRMPSYAHLPEEDRVVLAKYMSSLKVEDWYLEQTKKAEFEKLTGKKYQHD